METSGAIVLVWALLWAGCSEPTGGIELDPVSRPRRSSLATYSGPINGMFLVIKNRYNGCNYVFDQARWNAELSAMSDMGVRTVVLLNTATYYLTDGTTRTLYPSTNFSMETGCPNGTNQVSFLLQAARTTTPKIQVWLGTIWRGVNEDAWLTSTPTPAYQTSKLVEELSVDQNYDGVYSDVFAGIYIFTESEITTGAVYSWHSSVLNAVDNLWTGSILWSPPYNQLTYPAQSTPAIPPDCDGNPPGERNLIIPAWALLPLVDAQAGMENVIGQMPQLTHIAPQDALGKQMVNYWQPSVYFDAFQAATNLGGREVVYNLEAFDLATADGSCATLHTQTTTMAEIAHALSEAAEASMTEIWSFEWITNWSPLANAAGSQQHDNYDQYRAGYVSCAGIDCSTADGGPTADGGQPGPDGAGGDALVSGDAMTADGGGDDLAGDSRVGDAHVSGDVTTADGGGPPGPDGSGDTGQGDSHVSGDVTTADGGGDRLAGDFPGGDPHRPGDDDLAPSGDGYGMPGDSGTGDREPLLASDLPPSDGPGRLPIAGCSCRTSQPSSPVCGLLLGLAIVLLSRRRRHPPAFHGTGEQWRHPSCSGTTLNQRLNCSNQWRKPCVLLPGSSSRS